MALGINDASLRGALEWLFESINKLNNTNKKFVIGPEVTGRVSLQLHTRDLNTALTEALRGTPYDWRIDNDVYLIGKRMDAGTGVAVPPAAEKEKLVTLDLRDSPIRNALMQLFATSGQQYVIDEQVRGTVTLRIRDKKFEEALKIVTASNSFPLTYTKKRASTKSSYAIRLIRYLGQFRRPLSWTCKTLR
ncbi:MAG: hypothetical protein QM758_09010 [Armatimonas sp.]